MEYVEIANTHLRASRLAFGTASLHHLYSQRQRQRLLEAAFSAGITHFDTSPYYGFGLAESDLGAFMQGRRSQVTVASKVGLYAPGVAAHGSFGVWARKAFGKFSRGLAAPRIDWHVQTAAHSLNASLKRLRTDYVDLLLLHEPDPSLIQSDEFLAWLEVERSKGKVRYWGLAGMPGLLEKWLCTNHPLAMIIQTKDSLAHKEADIVLKYGRRLQFTYGYLSSATSDKETKSADTVLREALQRNKDGSIVCSTRRLDRVAKLTEAMP